MTSSPRGRLLAALALLWLTALAFWPAARSSPAGLTGTVALIAVIFAASIRAMWGKGLVLVWPNLVQFGLFSALFYQVYTVCGPDHFRCERGPYWHDWIEFTAVHALRAADLVDFLDEYGINLQHVEHRSTAAGVGVVALHVVADTFLIGFVAAGCVRYWRRRQERLHRDRHLAEATIQDWLDLADREHRRKFVEWLAKRVLAVGLVGSIAGYVAFGIVGEWSWQNWLLWPLDNALRTLDFADMFQIFRWKLHTVESGTGLSTLAVVFRLCVGVYAAGLILAVRLRWLRGAGLPIDDVVRATLDRPGLADDETLRRDAEALLGGFGAEAVVSALLDAAENPDAEYKARQLLTEVARRSGEVAPLLVGALRSDRLPVRAAALETLARLGTGPAECREDLLRMMRDSAGYVLTNSAAANLSRLHEGVLSNGARLLEQIGAGAEDVGVLILASPATVDGTGVLDRTDPAWRRGEVARAAVPELINGLLGRDDNVHERAELLLGEIDEHWRRSDAANAVAAELARRLTEGDDSDRIAAADALGRLGEAATPWLPALAVALVDRERNVAYKVRIALEKLRPDGGLSDLAGTTLPTFIRALADADADVRGRAASQLGKLGPRAKEALPELVSALTDADPGVVRAAQLALAEIDPDWRASEATRKTLPSLVQALKDPQPRVRQAAAEVLGKIGPEARSTVPALLELYAAADYPTKMAVVKSLGEVGPEASAAIPLLVRALENQWEGQELQWRARTALEKIDPDTARKMKRG